MHEQSLHKQKFSYKLIENGRPLDDDSAKEMDMINERMSNNERSTDQPPHNISWEGDVYSQVLGNEKGGYVRGLGLGTTPSVLWEYSSNEVVQRLEQEITELKEKQNEEMDLMKQNHKKLQSELLQMRQFMQNTLNERQQEGVPQSSRISNNAEITLPHDMSANRTRSF
ncbi:hypothetical protein KY289_009590 [Solanum tuberosum]|nr:hypothetical protein KY289_009590 [Solanum tuberosum]